MVSLMDEQRDVKKQLSNAARVKDK